eukprot:7786456-Heterocapsa_arctica.AAC.2
MVVDVGPLAPGVIGLGFRLRQFAGDVFLGISPRRGMTTAHPLPKALRDLLCHRQQLAGDPAWQTQCPTEEPPTKGDSAVDVDALSVVPPQ